MPNAPSVKTLVYEGPLDLLLDLIEKRKLLINDISLAEVTEEYIASIHTMESMPVAETTEFVSLAATLLLIKSRSLLPTLSISGEESKDIKELQYRLAVYQLVKDAAGDLGKALRRPYLFEGTVSQEEPRYIYDDNITPAALRAFAQILIDGFPAILSLPKVEMKKIVSLESMIEHMAKRVSSALQVSFREFSGLHKKTDAAQYAHMKQIVIVSFLALLELLKQGILKAQQQEHFGDIMLQSDDVSVPTYE